MCIRDRDIDKPLRRIIECEALVFCMSVCESLGVILLQCILQAADIKNVNEMMLYCLEAVSYTHLIRQLAAAYRLETFRWKMQ